MFKPHQGIIMPSCKLSLYFKTLD